MKPVLNETKDWCVGQISMMLKHQVDNAAK